MNGSLEVTLQRFVACWHSYTETWYLLIYLSRHLDQATVTFLAFRVKLPPVTTSLTTQKLEAILLSVLPKDTSELADTSELYTIPSILNQSRKAVNTNFLNIFWSDSMRESNPGLPMQSGRSNHQTKCQLHWEFLKCNFNFIAIPYFLSCGCFCKGYNCHWINAT